ncbi:cation:proton antiporter domain-containing protein [Cupriavidus basilensis]
MEVETTGFLATTAPILLLAIGAVLAASAERWPDGVPDQRPEPYRLPADSAPSLSTTDPSTVIALFQSSGAPARLIRLIEGESLFNDAAAIAIRIAVDQRAFCARPVQVPVSTIRWRDFLFSLIGGCLLGSAARCAAGLAVGLAAGACPSRNTSCHLALPGLLYPFCRAQSACVRRDGGGLRGPGGRQADAHPCARPLT